MLSFTSLTLTGSYGAFVIASTNFDGRVLSPTNTATALNWTVSGVSDPGNIAAFRANGTTAQPLLDNTSLTQNMFAPALNTGNDNTFWIADVALTPTAGSTISVTDVTFDYLALGGGGTQNPDRPAGFDVTLFSPSSVSLGTIFAQADNGTNTSSGVGTTVTLTFASSIALSESGTYTLRIRGGDITPVNATGNHTGIDNLTINGIPEPSSAVIGVLGLLALLRRRR